MNKKKSISPPTFLLIYIILTLTIHLLLPIKIVTDSFRIFGFLFIICGLGINIWADHWFKKEKTPVKPNERPKKLIIKGPFQFSRHPMYLGFVLLLLGISIILGSLSSFFGPILMFVTLEYKFIPFEEKIMEKIFGEKYLNYKHQVRRWI